MSDQGFSWLPETLVLDGCGVSSMDLHPDRVMPIWVLGTIERGRMPLAIGEVQQDLRWGDFYLLPPGIRHRGFGRAHYEVTFWHFRCDLSSPPCFRVPWFGHIPADVDTAQIMRTAERMRDRGDDWRWIVTMLSHLIARLSSHHRGIEIGPTGGIAEQIQAWLIAHRERAWDRVALERSLGFSYRYLNRIFHARFGQAIRARHLELRIQLAKERLGSGASLKQAADAAGFSDYFNFLRRFRQIAGVTAGSYQRAMIGSPVSSEART